MSIRNGISFEWQHQKNGEQNEGTFFKSYEKFKNGRCIFLLSRVEQTFSGRMEPVRRPSWSQLQGAALASRKGPIPGENIGFASYLASSGPLEGLDAHRAMRADSPGGQRDRAVATGTHRIPLGICISSLYNMTISSGNFDERQHQKNVHHF